MDNFVHRIDLSKLVFLAASLVLSFTLASCATAPVKHPYKAVEYDVQLAGPQDIVHVVAPGETLWRLSKMYGVSVEELMRANNLKAPQELATGQHLVIRQAMPTQPVIPLYPSNKWKHIIIHHSATDMGNAMSLFKIHLKRGFWHGLGYDFVIGNGSYGKADGQIEISHRWIRQEDGAHCKASGMNHTGIGICLVGNFSKTHISKGQFDSLIYLVNILRRYYNIPVENIMGHGQVPGAATECPGKHFPWKEFYNRLKTVN